MGPAFVEVHTAFLVDEGLQQFVLSVSNLNLNTWRCHELPMNVFCAARLRRDGGSLRRDLGQPAQLALLQDLAQVDQKDQAALQLSDSAHVVQFAVFSDARGT